jgi:chemotaxis signal transduction protein
MTVSISNQKMAGSHPRLDGNYLAVAVGRGFYGIPTRMTREVLSMRYVRAIPHMPPHVAGLVNTRGEVIPVVDLRLIPDLLTWGRAKMSAFSCQAGSLTA